MVERVLIHNDGGEINDETKKVVAIERSRGLIVQRYACTDTAFKDRSNSTRKRTIDSEANRGHDE